MSANPKLQNSHLARKAVIYVRQSSMAQVHANLESQRRQYGLAERARQLGFSQVEVIDQDLGRSASGAELRPGFERLAALVLSGEVGAVLCIEASRLARNGRDWHHLMDLCALCDTLIIDPDGVYDPRHSNDRLLLGLKGSMSEFELSLLRQRSEEARKQKAARGELQFRLPVGLEWTPEGCIALDPDLRVQEALRLAFRKLTELGSVIAVHKWFIKEQLALPAIPLGGGLRPPRPTWSAPHYSTLLCIYKNPLYAGAYAYGRRGLKTRVVQGRALKSHGQSKPMQAWSVLLLDHHPGYIPWSEYLRNQQMLKEHTHHDQAVDRRAGRGGCALLAGMVRCRRCGRRMRVHYRSPTSWLYQCRGTVHVDSTSACQYLGGYQVDQSVSAELIRALSPCAIEAAVLAAKKQEQARLDTQGAVALEREQAQYQVELAARRYEEVDPHNRLVALELERRWEQALSHLAEVQKRLDAVRNRPATALEPDGEQLLSLARDLATVWNAPQADPSLKQRLVSLLLEEVLCDVDTASNEVLLMLHWRGGRHSEVRMPKTGKGKTRYQAPVQVKQLLSAHSGEISDDEMATLLNDRGLLTGHGHRWTAERVRTYLDRHALGKYSEPTAPGLSAAAAAKHLGISDFGIRSLIARGLLPSGQRCANGTCHIPPEALHTPEVQAAVRALQAARRRPDSRGDKGTPSNT
jgi:DNA invertase Pin-like site-specific DNA recombinase